MSRRITGVATKKQRQRQLARQAHQRRLQRQVVRARRQKQWAAGGTAAVIVVGVGVLAAVLAVSSPGKGKANAGSSPSASASATPTPTPSPSGTPAMVDGKCVYIKSGTATRKVSLPPATPDTKATYTATVKTNRGDIVIDLLNSKAPCTVNSFVSLADQKFFNDSSCPRVTTSESLYILQCGDSKGSTNGSPGYGYGSENLTGATYDAGTLAMANSGTPDSNGSQFFMIYKNSTLSPDYTPFGRIVSGLNILQNVASHGFGKPVNPYGGGPPKEKVQIESVTISKT